MAFINGKQTTYGGKVVVITGGSRALGLVLARQLAAQGAKLALLARDEKELHLAVSELSKKTAVDYFICDVRSEEQVERAIDAVLEKFKTIDVLINNAGVVQVGPLETMTGRDFREAMNDHFFASLYTTFAVLPTMRKRRFGRIVNISSVGGKVSVPHLLPYTASEFALVGLSEGLRTELIKDGIYVTTVCPGLLRTDSHLQADFKGQNELEYAWFSKLNSMPFLSTAAEDAANQILEACKHGEAELVISLPAVLATKFQACFPETTSNMLALVNRVLPSVNGTNIVAKKGKESRIRHSPNLLTQPIEQAAEENNQWSERSETKERNSA